MTLFFFKIRPKAASLPSSEWAFWLETSGPEGVLAAIDILNAGLRLAAGDEAGSSWVLVELGTKRQRRVEYVDLLAWGREGKP